MMGVNRLELRNMCARLGLTSVERWEMLKHVNWSKMFQESINFLQR